MPPSPQPRQWQPWAVVLITVSAVTAARFGLNPLITGQVPLLLYVLAVLVSAAVGGFWPGVTAGAMSLLIARYYFMEPFRSFLVTNVADAIRVISFALVSLGVSWICAAMRTATQRALENITEARKAEQALRDREEQVRQIGDNLPDGFLYQVLANPSGERRFVHFSAGVERITGVPAEAALQDATQLYSLIHPGDIPALQAEEERCLRDGSTYQVIARLRHATSGKWYWAHMRSAPRTISTGETIWDGVFLDITQARETEEALQRSNERLELAQRAGHIGVFDWNVQSGEVVWNDEERRIFGREPGTFGGMIDDAFRGIQPEDAAKLQQEIKQAMDRREPEMEVAFRIIRPDEQIRWVEGAARFVYEEDGTPLRMVGVNVDLTAQKRAERELREAKEAAEAASKAKDYFLAVLSHELRTPLAPVVPLLGELISRGGLAPQVQEDLRTIQRNIALESRLIDDLLDLTRILRGKMELRKELVEVHELLAQSRTICCTDEVLKKGIRVELERHASHSHVFADPTRLQQVFWNLLNNAAKFSPPGAVVTVRTSDCAEGMLCVEVIDQGAGICQTLRPRLFQPFEQGNRYVGGAQSGLGLGLAITKSLVEAHGGAIEVESEGAGKGATFRVTLPVATPLDLQPGSTSSNGHAAPQSTNTAASIERILLVEDHLDTAMVMTRLLASRGFTVELASSKKEALQLGQTRPFDLLISDLGLPDGSGIEVMEELRQRGPTRGIALSGFGAEADIESAKKAGFRAHLVKPVDFESLLKVIAECAGAE